MIILVINDYGFANGGASKVAISSLNRLAESGHRVFFVYSVGPLSSEVNTNLVSTHNLGGYDLVDNPSRINALLSGLWNRHAVLKLRRILEIVGSDDSIVHVHSWTKSLSSAIFDELKRFDMKVCLTLHDYFLVCPNGGLFNYQERMPCKIKPMSMKCISTHCDSRSYPVKVWRTLRQFITNKLHCIKEQVDCFITVSSFSERIIQQYLPEANFRRVDNPISFNKNKRSQPSDHKLFTFIGRLDPEKGASVLAKAAVIAGVDVRFVGSGAEYDLIKSINSRAQLLGWRNSKEVRDFISSSRAVVFPSLWYETQGMVVAECAALGIPVIVSRGIASSEYVEHNQTGLLFELGDIDQLASCLTKLSESPELADRLGSSFYEKYWSNPYCEQRHIDGLLETYKDLVQFD